jgi:hypothetical protein
MNNGVKGFRNFDWSYKNHLFIQLFLILINNIYYFCMN